MHGYLRKADLVADDLLRRIVAGELEVGALLPKEDELADRYGVNRSVIREAIKLLEVHRLVHPVRRRGTEVLDPLASVTPAVLHAMLQPRHGEIDRSILAGILEVRASLDVEMGGLAALRRTDADLSSMEACLVVLRGTLRTSPVDYDRYDAAMSELSLAVARSTHNTVFEMLAHWNIQVMAQLREVFRGGRPATEPHVQGLEGVVALIRQRDAETTRQLIAGYHQWATPRILAAAALHSGEPLPDPHQGVLTP